MSPTSEQPAFDWSASFGSREDVEKVLSYSVDKLRDCLVRNCLPTRGTKAFLQARILMKICTVDVPPRDAPIYEEKIATALGWTKPVLAAELENLGRSNATGLKMDLLAQYVSGLMTSTSVSPGPVQIREGEQGYESEHSDNSEDSENGVHSGSTSPVHSSGDMHLRCLSFQSLEMRDEYSNPSQDAAWKEHIVSPPDRLQQTHQQNPGTAEKEATDASSGEDSTPMIAQENEVLATLRCALNAVGEQQAAAVALQAANQSLHAVHIRYYALRREGALDESLIRVFERALKLNDGGDAKEDALSPT